MKVRMIVLALLVLTVAATPGWAQTQTCTPPEEGNSCTITFSPGTQGTSTGIFDFSGTGDGILAFKFDTVLTTFTLTVTANDVSSIDNIDQNELPGATCIDYVNGHCVRYDLTGNAGGPNGVPVRGTDYQGLINMTLNYDSLQQIDIPVFGHAPGDNSTDVFSENILTSYVDENAPSCTLSCEEPAMGGKTPSLSSFAALTQPFAGQALIVCPALQAIPHSSTAGSNPLVEVNFQLIASGGNCTSGPFLRDKTASLFVASSDTNGNLVFANLINGGAANKFHYDSKTGLNVQDINTNGLPAGFYYVTVISSQFSPVTTTFTLPLN
jgi:hypothetical protein